MGVVCPLFLLSMIDKIKEVIEPVLKEEQVELVKLIFRKEAGKQVLRILADKESGIQMADCVRLNQRIGQVLDEANIIQESYIIEVDSPGIDRLFETKRDYQRAIGRLVRVTLNEKIQDKKEYIAKLEEVSDRGVKIDVKKKGVIDIPFENILRTKGEVEF